ncbi:hypothetical protein HJC23_003135 [Cyclotella cryptica]|uniref:Mitochondrial carrier protein n=1 Tax=Cyclotella cryptica TaxID=29204 RepID=A0ABD3P3Z5_9STRA|eukprot:CCRYP_017514-RA/>CCRYP_017514-RA protein AED:0.00 eAED:0.00 QI:415/1/1/1/0/0/2/80/393
MNATAAPTRSANSSSSAPPCQPTQSSPSNQMPQPTQPLSFHLGEEAIGGFAAGVVGTLLGFPLDLVKTRMQTQDVSSTPKSRLSPLSLLRHILKTEGISSLYKGVGPPLLSLSIVNTLSFTSYSYFRQNHFNGTDGWDYRNALSGTMGAPLFGLVTTPENFLKTQMQLDNVQDEREKIRKNSGLVESSRPESTQKLKGRFSGSFHCAKTLVSSHGFTILYTGHVINTIREAAFVGMYFYCYEGYKCEFKKIISTAEKLCGGALFSSSADSANESKLCESYAASLAIPLAGGCAGATSWAFTFPLDCVRAGVQGQVISAVHIQKQGALETLKQLWKTKGITGLYAGVGPSIARAFLVSGSRFSAYEGALALCRWSGLSAGNGKYGEEGAGPYDD